ncbi:HNH endonuclease [Bacillus sonorensis]|uniref:HNH endonuclease n=1 Tax=Bacillus sonorensis TaxID=119858 RepID=UPI00228118A6|nr:HNH endonuclease [Bacillus sonorensis]MCY8024546.1 HNH endonuclease [Bacillus sonorensis]
MYPTVEIEGAKPTNRSAAFKQANLKAGLNKDSDPPEGHAWHHHEDGKTMVLVDKIVH